MYVENALKHIENTYAPKHMCPKQKQESHSGLTFQKTYFQDFPKLQLLTVPEIKLRSIDAVIEITIGRVTVIVGVRAGDFVVGTFTGIVFGLQLPHQL